MGKIRNVNEITEDDLIKINNCLVRFESYLQDVTRQPTDKNIALYEHWVDCRVDIEDIIITKK